LIPLKPDMLKVCKVCGRVWMQVDRPRGLLKVYSDRDWTSCWTAHVCWRWLRRTVTDLINAWQWQLVWPSYVGLRDLIAFARCRSPMCHVVYWLILLACAYGYTFEEYKQFIWASRMYTASHQLLCVREVMTVLFHHC